MQRDQMPAAKAPRRMRDANTLQFLGATGTVTGWKHTLTVNDRRILMDCGLFQGRA